MALEGNYPLEPSLCLYGLFSISARADYENILNVGFQPVPFVEDILYNGTVPGEDSLEETGARGDSPVFRVAVDSTDFDNLFHESHLLSIL